MREKILLSLYGKVKPSWGRQMYTSCYTTKERKKGRKEGKKERKKERKRKERERKKERKKVVWHGSGWESGKYRVWEDTEDAC
jgi:hypothetical protein